jgi:hypothetical protein
MKKITVVTDRSGQILATYMPTAPGKDTPKYTFIQPLEGQHVHEVEISDDNAKPEFMLKLHRTHRIELSGRTAKLVEYKQI